MRKWVRRRGGDIGDWWWGRRSEGEVGFPHIVTITEAASLKN